MIRPYTAKASRRALNIVWNAAGRYDFDPQFLAFLPDGEADAYFDLIIGLTEKWLGLSELQAVFLSYRNDRRREEFDEYLWLGLENYVYEKELPDRPVLKDLRIRRGELFFRNMQKLSRQQMMLLSMPVHFQQLSRWSAVTGKKLPRGTAREERMRDALLFSGSMEKEQVFSAMRSFLQEFFGYGEGNREKENNYVNRILQFCHTRRDRGHSTKDILLIRTGIGGNQEEEASLLPSFSLAGKRRFTKGAEKEDEDYIRALFGDPLIPEAELLEMERSLCAGKDAGKRLWIAGGSGGLTENKGKSPAGTARERKLLSELSDTALRRKKQKLLNERALKDQAFFVKESIGFLSAGLKTFFESVFSGLPEKSRRGRLAAQRAWRIGVLGETDVFIKEGEERDLRVFADLLLDASQSRMNMQERIALEAYILAESMRRAGVTVSVFSFRSLRGFTVLERLKEGMEADCRGVLSYCAGGWNRDSLALKAMHQIIRRDRKPEELHLLFVLTDASPHDPGPEGEFEGTEAVGAAEEAVKELRKDGIRTAAVFHGASAHLEDAHRIYGNDLLRIHKLSQLAEGATDLMKRMLESTY